MARRAVRLAVPSFWGAGCGDLVGAGFGVLVGAWRVGEGLDVAECCKRRRVCVALCGDARAGALDCTMLIGGVQRLFALPVGCVSG